MRLTLRIPLLHRYSKASEARPELRLAYTVTAADYRSQFLIDSEGDSVEGASRWAGENEDNVSVFGHCASPLQIK